MYSVQQSVLECNHDIVMASVCTEYTLYLNENNVLLVLCGKGDLV